MNMPVIPANFNDGSVTMSSREIAELCEKRHAHVLRDIEQMLHDISQPKFGSANFEAEYVDAQGKLRKEYRLPKDLTATLITGYRADLRYRVVKRLEELEKGSVAGNKVLPDFSDAAAAARAWADQYDARLLAERTKAEIGARREATAMNTASQAVKRVRKLEAALDRSQKYATIKRMQALYQGKQFSWRDLRCRSEQMKLPPIDVFDANYGSVKAYHADVWRELYEASVPPS